MTATDIRIAEVRNSNKYLRTKRVAGPIKCDKCTATIGKLDRRKKPHQIWRYVNARTNKVETRCLKHL